MRRGLLFCVLLLSGILSWSQNAPSHVQVFGGYSYVPTNFAWLGGGENGWNAAVDVNSRRWYGFTADFAQYYATFRFSVAIRTCPPILPGSEAAKTGGTQPWTSIHEDGTASQLTSLSTMQRTASAVLEITPIHPPSCSGHGFQPHGPRRPGLLLSDISCSEVPTSATQPPIRITFSALVRRSPGLLEAVWTIALLIASRCVGRETTCTATS